jgi:hypothetical protein
VGQNRRCSLVKFESCWINELGMRRRLRSRWARLACQVLFSLEWSLFLRTALLADLLGALAGGFIDQEIVSLGARFDRSC